jgi:hypothetical protein
MVSVWAVSVWAVSVWAVSVWAVSVDGDELKKFKLGVDAEHAATVKPHAITTMTRLISDPTARTAYAAYPTKRANPLTSPNLHRIRCGDG